MFALFPPEFLPSKHAFFPCTLFFFFFCSSLVPTAYLPPVQLACKWTESDDSEIKLLFVCYKFYRDRKSRVKAKQKKKWEIEEITMQTAKKKEGEERNDSVEVFWLLLPISKMFIFGLKFSSSKVLLKSDKVYSFFLHHCWLSNEKKKRKTASC